MAPDAIRFEKITAKHTLGILLLAIVAVKAVIIWIVVPLAAKYGFVPDTVATARDLYFHIARNLVGGHGFQVTPDTAPTMMRAPGYVLFLSGIQALFGDRYVFMQIANLICGLAATGIVFLLTRKLTGSQVCAAIAALIVAFNPGILVMETRINLEIFFILVLCIFVLMLFRAFERRTLGSFLLAGLSLGLVVLTRSSPIVIIPLIFVFLLLRDGRSLPATRNALLQTAVLTCGALLVVSPWMARNYALSGNATFSENLLGVVAFQGQYATRTMGNGVAYRFRILEAREVQRDIAAGQGVAFRRFERDQFWDIFPTIDDEQRYEAVLRQEVLKHYVEDPLLFVKHCALNTVRFWFQGGTPKITLIGLPITLALLVLAIAGAYTAIRQRLPVAPIFLVILTVYAVHIPLISHARYSVPLIPMLAILAGIALSRTRLGGKRASDPAITTQ